MTIAPNTYVVYLFLLEIGLTYLLAVIIEAILKLTEPQKHVGSLNNSFYKKYKIRPCY